MIESREVEFRWRASQLTRAIATCAGVALTAAVVATRWQLIAFAAPLLGVLCSISWQRPVPKIRVHGKPDSQRCFENEQVSLTVWATAESGIAKAPAVELTVSSVEGMQLEVLDVDSRPAKTVA
ncbi:MAG TPA: DUF58 domain-containing protein, partial [Mycobacterium sp.]|nr:DUF58 domain-containing protein [Mycobacterium sp.]